MASFGRRWPTFDYSCIASYTIRLTEKAMLSGILVVSQFNVANATLEFRPG